MNDRIAEELIKQYVEVSRPVLDAQIDKYDTSKWGKLVSDYIADDRRGVEYYVYLDYYGNYWHNNLVMFDDVVVSFSFEEHLVEFSYGDPNLLESITQCALGFLIQDFSTVLKKQS